MPPATSTQALPSDLLALVRLWGSTWSVRRGLMQDYANQIAQMFIGYQITLVDMPLLVAKGQGRVEVDLLGQTTSLDGEPISRLSISDAVRAWYEDAIVRDDLGDAFVRQIQITCDFDIAESRKGLDIERHVAFNCKVAIEAENGPWQGTSRKSELWLRSGDGPWIVRDS